MKRTIYSITLLLAVQSGTILGMLVPQNDDPLVRSAQRTLLLGKPDKVKNFSFDQFNEGQINQLIDFRTEAENRINLYEREMAPIHFRSNLLFGAAGITPVLLWNKTNLWSLPEIAAKTLLEQDVPRFNFSNFAFNSISLFSMGYLFYNAIPTINQFLVKYHLNNVRKNLAAFNKNIHINHHRIETRFQRAPFRLD